MNEQQIYQNRRQAGLPEFSNTNLNKIIAEEIKSGNEIVEITSWPPRCKILVILKKKFCREYAVEAAVVFAIIDDPHYWYAEYRTVNGSEALVCQFH